MKKEIWKDIPNYPAYQVSNLGRVKSIKKNLILKSGDNGNGYRFVHIFNSENKQRFYIHRLVCMVFLPNPENKKMVNHKDLDKSNNELSNLEWVTPRENNLHRYKFKPSKLKGRGGVGYHTNKKVIQKSKDGEIICIFDSLTIASKETKTNVSCISSCCTGNRKSAGGFKWSHYES